MPSAKILDLPLAPAALLAPAPTSALSLGRRLEAAPVTVTFAVAAAQAVSWAGSEPSRPRCPWSPVRQTPKSMSLPIIDIADGR